MKPQKPTSKAASAAKHSNRCSQLKDRETQVIFPPVTQGDLQIPVVFFHDNYLVPKAEPGVIANTVLYRAIPYVYDAYHAGEHPRATKNLLSSVKTNNRGTQRAAMLFRMPALNRAIKFSQERLRPVNVIDNLEIIGHLSKIKTILKKASVMVVMINPKQYHDYVSVFHVLNMIVFPIGVKYHLAQKETDRVDRMDLEEPYAICVALNRDSIIGMANDPKAKAMDNSSGNLVRYMTRFLSEMHPPK